MLMFRMLWTCWTGSRSRAVLLIPGSDLSPGLPDAVQTGFAVRQLWRLVTPGIQPFALRCQSAYDARDQTRRFIASRLCRKLCSSGVFTVYAISALAPFPARALKATISSPGLWNPCASHSGREYRVDRFRCRTFGVVGEGRQTHLRLFDSACRYLTVRAAVR